jgi:hypothetical protein
MKLKLLVALVSTIGLASIATYADKPVLPNGSGNVIVATSPDITQPEVMKPGVEQTGVERPNIEEMDINKPEVEKPHVENH